LPWALLCAICSYFARGGVPQAFSGAGGGRSVEKQTLC